MVGQPGPGELGRGDPRPQGRQDADRAPGCAQVRLERHDHAQIRGSRRHGPTEARQPFYRGKESHYQRLLNQDAPGAAWFRHEVRESRLARGTKTETPSAGERVDGFRNRNDLSRSYELFSGGRAISENLQLDRELPAGRTKEGSVKLDSLTGISVREIDWKPLVKDLKPPLDPLASLVPADQHVVFFPTFQAAIRVADEVGMHGMPLVQLAEPRSEDARTEERYQRQLCLSLTGLGRLLGPRVARSVALTGSDTYYPTGTDVAVLFEAPQPALLEGLLIAQINLVAARNRTAKPVEGEIQGVTYRGVRSPDRSVSSYVARIKNVVVVTNSTYQLERLASVARGKSKSIASLPEYTFFRGRYRQDDPQETALVFLSDATIRRWCSPRWRIANSRRTRDAAVMAELQASQMDRLVKAKVVPGPLYTNLPIASAGELTLTRDGVASQQLGTLGFMTPIAEMPLSEVTATEAEAYNRWRDGYQRNWNWAFDPIALRLSIAKGRLAADLTVMPLIAGTEYREFVSISRGAHFSPNAGDQHDALAHFILALNHQSPMFQTAGNFLAGAAKGATLGWVGSSIAVYAEEDPFWADLAKQKESEVNRFFEKNIGRLPVGVQIEVSSGFKLAAFLAGLRAYVDQTAPGMTQWQSFTYRDEPYVRIRPSERAQGGRMGGLENIEVYYSASGDALLLTLREDLLKRAVDRQIARRAKSKAEDAKEPGKLAAVKPWLGSNVALHVDRRFLDVLAAMNRRGYEQAMQLRAWGNLPVLNEWKRHYPDEDPVAVHRRVWHTELLCPGHGKYVWNDRWQTMESTVYGHPGQPKTGPVAPPVLSAFSSGDFGLTFENQGLRARVELERAAEKAAPPGKSK